MKVLAGARAYESPKRAAAGILGWPGGAEIVGAIGTAVGVVAAVNVYWGLSGRFLESLRMDGLDGRLERLVTVAGKLGFVALGFVLGVIAWFLVKAAADFNAGTVVSLGGAMSRLAQADYGDALLSGSAVGLLAYGLFGLLQARYHKV